MHRILGLIHWIHIFALPFRPCALAARKATCRHHFRSRGAYGYLDHIAISQLTTAAIVCAANPSYENCQQFAAHRISELYYMAWSHAKWTAFQAALREIKMNIDGVERQATLRRDWAVTALIDTESY